MTVASVFDSSQLTEILVAAKKLTSSERLLIAKILLDSVVSDEIEDGIDWQYMGLSAFEKDWDNPDDAIYDNWREIYGVSKG